MITSLRAEAGRRPILAHPKDIHCIVFHVLVVAAYGLAFWLYLHPERAGITSGVSKAAFIAASAIMLGWISGIDVGVNFHNHTHRRIFRRSWMNRWFGRLWTVTGGWPSFYWDYSHVVVHHAHVLGPTDWTLPRRKSDGTWENYYKYCLLHWPFRYAVHFWQDFRAGRGGKRLRWRAVKELAIFAPLWLAPFFVDFWMAVWLWLLPHYIANVVVMGAGMYAQHAGREAPNGEHSLRHSNCFVSKFFNYTMFNIGYHALHHTYPYVHWSDLPAKHVEMKPRLIEEGAHVVPFGYYRGGMLLAASAGRGSKRAHETFEAQHPDYVRVDESPDDGGVANGNASNGAADALPRSNTTTESRGARSTAGAYGKRVSHTKREETHGTESIDRRVSAASFVDD